MPRVDDYLQLIDDPSRPALRPGDPADPVLQSLLVHLAFADGVVQGDEFALLQRVRPDLPPGELMEWATEVVAVPLSMPHVRSTCPDEAAAWSCLRFAARVVCLDGDLHAEELEHLRGMAHELGLPTEAASTVVRELVATGGAVSEDQVRASLRHMIWDVLVPSHDGLTSALAGVVPAGVQVVCSIALDGDEVAALYVEGLAGYFDSGPVFVPWADIATYTRVPVPGAAFHLVTVADRDLSMSDPRLRDVGALLDLIYGRTSIS